MPNPNRLNELLVKWPIMQATVISDRLTCCRADLSLPRVNTRKWNRLPSARHSREDRPSRYGGIAAKGQHRRERSASQAVPVHGDFSARSRRCENAGHNTRARYELSAFMPARDPARAGSHGSRHPPPRQRLSHQLEGREPLFFLRLQSRSSMPAVPAAQRHLSPAT